VSVDGAVDPGSLTGCGGCFTPASEVARSRAIGPTAGQSVNAGVDHEELPCCGVRAAVPPPLIDRTYWSGVHACPCHYLSIAPEARAGKRVVAAAVGGAVAGVWADAVRAAWKRPWRPETR